MVADTYSSALGWLIMGKGNDNNSWGDNCNNNIFQVFEDAIAGVYSSNATSGTVDLSGTPPPSGPSQARFWQLKFTGSLSGDLTVKVPNLSKGWLVNNACTLNGHAVTIKTPSGSAAAVPPGYQQAWCDGTDNIFVSPYNSNQILMPDGSAASPTHSFLNEKTSGLYRNGSGDLRVAVGGSDIIRVTSSLLDILSGKSLAFNGSAIDLTAFLPTGIVLPWFDDNLPNSGFVWANGGEVSRTGVGAALFSRWGTRYGAGNGVTTFNVVNLCELTMIGARRMGGAATRNRVNNTTFNTIGNDAGEESHVLSTGEMPSHNHSASDSGHTHGYTALDTSHVGGGVNGGNAGSFALFTSSPFTVGATTGSGNANISVANNGGGGAHNNMQPSIATGYVVKL